MLGLDRVSGYQRFSQTATAPYLLQETFNPPMPYQPAESQASPPPPVQGSKPLSLQQQQHQQQLRDQAAHQRTYQACIPCRRRKVRCDLGSVDNPHDPPCTRCRRESKECFFSATRRKKRGIGEDGSGRGSDAGDDYELKSGRKRQRTSVAPEGDNYEDDNKYYDDVPRTPGGSVGRMQPLRRPEGSRQPQYGEEDYKASEQMAALLQGAEVHGGHDALKVLYEAAVRGRANSSASNGRPSITGPSPSSLPPATSPIMEKVQAGSGTYTTGAHNTYENDGVWKSTIPDTPHNVNSTPAESPDNIAAAIKAWSRFRFVRAGWFTAKEAIAYIQYFYQYLSPLTPVTLPDFRPLETHARLLTEEPMLTITILLIASRHMRLEGPGSLTRPYTIHQKLWTYLQGMINRVIWGMEQFGGGLTGAGSQPGCDVNPLSRKGLRTLGTVESMVLLTEWHPRAMHFPPDEMDDELMVPEEPFATPDPEGAADGAKGIGGQRMDAWLEPAWRSDRMCWMLLGLAMSLAFEIGVFDKSEWQRHVQSTNGQPLSAGELHVYDKRRGAVRDLLLVYVTLTSGRLGLTSMLPSNYTTPEDSDLYKRPMNRHDTTQETVMHFWLRIAAIISEGNRKIFRNKNFTRDLIKNGNYRSALDSMQPPLIQWRRDLELTPSIPKHMQQILLIEYEYTRVYQNALALQAVAERCANEYTLGVIDPPIEVVRSAITTNGVRTDVAIDPQTLAKWLGGDRHYIAAVRESACNLLKIVVDGLYPGEYLRHAPVRTYFRIISVAIMLLKSFSLGASEKDVGDSLKLMDRTVEALRTCIVDDVHVASRFADLLATLTQNLKPRLVRVAADGRQGRSRRDSQSGTPAPYNQQANNGQPMQGQYQQASAGAMAGQQWQYNSSEIPNSMAPGDNGRSSTMASNPHLYGITHDTYDLMADNSFSVMPPPTFGFNSPQNTNSNLNNAGGAQNTAGNTDAYGNYGSGFNPDDMQDWFALPLDPLLNHGGGDVNQTMYGPDIGGQDMLELLLSGGNGLGGNFGA